MSKIRVWTPKGEWSEEVVGLDKVDFMGKAISDEHHNNSFLIKSERKLFIDAMNKFEIDCKDIWEVYSYDDNGSWVLNPKSLAAATSFKMPLHTLESMIKQTPYLRDVYQKIVDLAQVPAGANADYCILLKFENGL